MRSESQYGCWLVRHVAVCVTVCARSALPRCLCAKERSAFIHTENLVSGLFEKVRRILENKRVEKKNLSIATEQMSTNKKEPQLLNKKTQERLGSKNLETSLRKSPDCCVFWVYALRVCVCLERYYSCTISCLEVVRPEVRYWWQPDMQHEIKTEGEDCGSSHNHPASRRLSEVTIVCFSSRHVFLTVAQERK